MSDKLEDVKLDTVRVDDIEAYDAEKTQHVKTDEKISVLESFRRYPFAALWSMYMLFICIMWGYDGMAAAIVLSIPRFRQDYGYPFGGDYVVSADWQMAFTGGGLGGMILGAYATGLLSKRWGERFCIASAYVLTIGGVFAQWFSPGNMPMFLGGKILTGIPLGVFLTIAPTYISEVAPPALRGPLVAAVNFSMVIGQLLGYGVMREVQAIDGPDSYRIMYAVQWGFAGVGLALIFFLPESPMRLVARGKIEMAKVSIKKLGPSDTDVDAKVDEIKAALEHNAKQNESAGGYRECFNAKNRGRTLTALSVYFFVACSGIVWVVGYMGYFMQLSGMQGMEVFDATVGVAGTMAVGAILGWFTVAKVGRRKTFLLGLFTCAICLGVIGVLTQFISKGKSVVLVQVAFMAIWAFVYQCSIGSCGFPLVAEIPTSHLRPTVFSMATMVNGFSNGIWALAVPYMINPDEGNMGGNIAWVFFAFLVIACGVGYFFYPETKDRSFEEIDALYERGVSPRHFASTKLD